MSISRRLKTSEPLEVSATMIDSKHTFMMADTHGKVCPLILTEEMLNTAPAEVKDVIEEMRLCIKFLEQFRLSGHFAYQPGKKINCYAVADIEKSPEEVFGSPDGGLDPTGGMSASLVLSVYAGLVYITDSPFHLNTNAESIRFVDSTAKIDWYNHVVLRIELREKPTDLIYVIPIFKRTDNEVLRLVGSYDPYNEEIHDEKGEKLSASKGVEERFRKLYGKRDLNKEVKGMGRKSKGN